MKKTLFFLIIPVIFSLIYSCSKPPVYPDTPSIAFKDLVTFASGDSVKITITYQDGDGDLGLTPDDINPPYERFDFITNSNGDSIKLGSNPSLPPYNCQDYSFTYLNGQPIHLANDTIVDTLLVKENLNYYNYFLDILIKQSNGTFTVLDLKFDCIQFNDRFPLLNSETGPIRGDLSYKIDISQAVSYINNQTIKFRISIQDRKLNKSNTVETSELYVSL